MIGALLWRAITKPINLLPAAIAMGLGFAFGLWWLVLGGLAVWGVLSVQSFFSVKEAQRVIDAHRGVERAVASRAAGGLPPEEVPELRDPAIRRIYAEALREERLIRESVAESPMPVDSVETELIGLKDELKDPCVLAERIAQYLGTVDAAELRARREAVRTQMTSASAELAETLARTESALADQLTTVETLQEQLTRFQAESLGIISTLGAIRGEVVRVSVADSGEATTRVREQLGNARELVRTLTDVLDAAPATPARAADGEA
jgi:hypothetical protein